jgi:hypothetical protein
MRTMLLLLALATGLVGSGCRFLAVDHEAADPVATLARTPRPRSSPQTVLLELLFVRCPPDDVELHDELWGFVDEQFLEVGVRGRLAANGLRVGIVSGQLPAHLADRLTGTLAADDATGSQPLATEAVVTRRQLRLLPGRRSEIVTASSLDELVLLEQSPEGVSGGTYRDASPLLAVIARPAADGRVTLEAVPEIRHGPVEKSWVGEDGMFRLETGQKRHRMEHLQFAATLPADAMLVVGSAGGETATVGDRLLRDHDRSGSAGLRLLVIRPLAATIDPLFCTDAASETAAADDAPLIVR